MSQMSSRQNPCSSATSRCCLARLQMVVFTSHAPFGSERTWLLGLPLRDGHTYLPSFGSGHVRAAAVRRQRPIQREEVLLRACVGTCVESPVSPFCGSTCGTDRSLWSTSLDSRSALPTSSRRHNRG